MTLPQNELCQICQNSRRTTCLVEQQRNIDMQKFLDEFHAFWHRIYNKEMTNQQRNAFCLFLSGLDEAERLFALNYKILPSTEHYDVYKKLKRMFDDLLRNGTEIKEDTYKYIKGQFVQEIELITEEAFEFFFKLVRSKPNQNSKYRQNTATRQVLEQLKGFLEYFETKKPLYEDEVIEKLKNKFFKPSPQLSTPSIQGKFNGTPESMEMLNRFIQEKNLNVSIEDN